MHELENYIVQLVGEVYNHEMRAKKMQAQHIKTVMYSDGLYFVFGKGERALRTYSHNTLFHLMARFDLPRERIEQDIIKFKFVG